MRDSLDFAAEVKFANEELGRIEGYASVFGLVDQGGDMVQHGAFKDTIKRAQKSGLPMLYQHDRYQPIGIWTSLVEDEKGLKVQGELVLGVKAADETYALVKKGAIRGLSIGFRTVNAGLDKETGARVLKTIDLYEISPVLFPMQREASITKVKGGNVLDLPSLDEREFERALRDEGLSAREAKIAISVTKRQVHRDDVRPGPGSRDASADALKEMLMSLRKGTALLQRA